MGVHLNDLPPKVREQVARKMVQDTSSGAARHRPIKGKAPTPGPAGHPLHGMASHIPGESKGAGKYHNQKAVRYVGDNAVRFDSQKEARRFDELLLLQKAGKIRELKLQVDFTLQEAYTMPDTGNRVRAIRYRADFTYLERVGDDFGYAVDRDVEIATSATPPADAQRKWRRQTPPEDAGPRNDKTRERIATTPAGSRNESGNWRLVVEDVKSDGTRTREYGIKRKLMVEKYGVQIREV